MTTQLEHARNGTATKQMEAVARNENIDIDTLISHISNGSVIIMNRGNNNGDVSVGIGKGLLTKVNVNLGTSTLKIDPDEEVKKARIAQRYGADTITDPSIGGNISQIRKLVMENTTLPIKTDTTYQAAAEKRNENLGLPCPEQVREGLIAFKIAAHIGDSIKYGPAQRDRSLARKRAMLDWEG